jgi:NitT/TauT family transport system substrate-binding protein
MGNDFRERSRPLKVGRRSILSAAAAGLAAPLAAVAAPRLGAVDRLGSIPICRVATEPAPAVTSGTPRTLKLTWNANAVCNVGVAVAQERGMFSSRGLAVEMINFAGATDQLLELIASGKADAGVGMALAWLKPLEQGFDVKLTTVVHGGCIRLLTSQDSGIRSLADLKGKTVGCISMAGPDRNFFSIIAKKQGLDPNKDLDWRAYPADLLSVALSKGEIRAFSNIDPLATIVRDRDRLHELANNLTGDFAGRACCIMGVRGGLIRDERPVAVALTLALQEAQEWVAGNPEGAGAVFAKYSKVATAEQLGAMLRSHTHHYHPSGVGLRQEIKLYAQDLKDVSVFKPATDPEKFAAQVCVDTQAA